MFSNTQFWFNRRKDFCLGSFSQRNIRATRFKKANIHCLYSPSNFTPDLWKNAGYSCEEGNSSALVWYVFSSFQRSNKQISRRSVFLQEVLSETSAGWPGSEENDTADDEGEFEPMSPLFQWVHLRIMMQRILKLWFSSYHTTTYRMHFLYLAPWQVV